MVERFYLPLVSIFNILFIVTESEKTDIRKRLECGGSILNVSATSKTPEIMRNIRKEFPEVPIMATGGPTPNSKLETIEAGANAITYTPPSTSDVFKSLMSKYRSEH